MSHYISNPLNSSPTHLNPDEFLASQDHESTPLTTGEMVCSDTSEDGCSETTHKNDICNYDVVIAHGPGCNDGATSAWAVWRTLPREYRELLASFGGFYSNRKISEQPPSSKPYLHPNSPEGGITLQQKGYPVVFVFIQPNNKVPDELVAGKRVLILDLDMGDSLIPLVSSASSVLLCDHHDSTPQTISKHSDFLLTQNRHKFATYLNTSKQESGATLAWRITHSANIPPFVQVVRIGDTWSWNDHPDLHSKAVLTSLNMSRSFRSFPEIEGTFSTWPDRFSTYVQKGYSVLEYEKSIVTQMAKHCDLGYIQTSDGTVYNVAYTQASVLHSDVGSSIRSYAEKIFDTPIHFCATWKFIPRKSLILVSLRDPKSGLNLSTIARNVKNGDGKGGGHPEAAGFSFRDIENFHNFILKSPPQSDQSSDPEDTTM